MLLVFNRMGIINEETHQHWMLQAIEAAKSAQALGEVPVGALIVQENKLLSVAGNHSIANHDACGHAEILAIRAAGQKLGNYRLIDCQLYVTLEPCLMCFGAMIHARIQQLIFGAYDKKAGGVLSQLQLGQQTFFNHQIKITHGVLADSCGALLSHFFQAKRKNKSKN